MPAPIRLVTLWIGPRLGRVERACLRSALRQGHGVTLYCYDVPEGVPEGVAIADAAAILPVDRIVRHRSGSPSLFSNLFRYELQRRALGTWIDADLYLLRSIDGERPTLFGLQDEATINGAVLRLPPDSPLLPPLIALFDEREVPFWLNPAERAAAEQGRDADGRLRLSNLPWGVAGPRALTALARRTGLFGKALPCPVFYPVPYQRAAWIRSPVIPLERVVGTTTVAVHLWNELIRGFKDEPATAGSFLARLQAEGA